MKRKLAAVLLGLTLISTSFQGVYANEKSEALTDVILKTKQQINLPEGLTEFDYSEYGENYRLSWHDKEASQSVQVNCSSDGKILSYNYDEPYEESSVAMIDYEKAKEVAEAFLEQAAKAYKSKLKLIDKISPSRSSYYALNYEVVEEGIPLLNEQVSVWVHKQTGKVIRFKGINYDESAIFESKIPKLTLEEAQKAYLKNIGLDLKYTLCHDENETKTFLIYSMRNSEQKGISAQTGKVITPYVDEVSLYKNSDITTESASLSSQDKGNGELLVYERVEVENRKTFLEPEEIVKKAAAFFPALNQYKIKDTYVGKYDEAYGIGIQFSNVIEDNGRGAMLFSDAKTGEILQYYGGKLKVLEALESETHNIDLAQRIEQGKWSEKDGQAFLEKIAPMNVKAVKLKGISVPSVDNETQYFYYERIANDIPVEGNGIYFSYDPIKKEITSYNKNWSQVSFESPSGKMSEAEMVKKIGLKLFYMKTGEHSYSLVYNHEDTGVQWDAYTGKKVNGLGEEIKEEAPILYTDIKGHPSEQIIKNLYYSGIYIHSNQLNPDKAITLEEMNQLLENFSSKKAEYPLLQKLASQPLTKEEGIYCMVTLTPYNKLASKSDLFVYPYQDEKVDEAYKGYIAAAYALGWLEKGETFNPTAPLTKADAMVYLYKALGDL